MKKFSSWLREQVNQHRTSLRHVARETGLPPNALSRWRAGKIIPGSGVLLLLADYFGEDPALVFRLAGKEELVEVYRPLFPDQPKGRLSEGDLYKNPKHARLHWRVQNLLMRGFEKRLEDWLGHQEPRSYLNFRLDEVVRLTKSAKGILFQELRDATGSWSEGFLVSVTPLSYSVVPNWRIGGRKVTLDWVKNPPASWHSFEQRDEREDGTIVIYLLLKKPTLEAHLEPLIGTYLEDWLAASWEGPEAIELL